MGKWLYGSELVQTRDWTPTELLNHIKNGLPAYDGQIDRRIYDRDALPRHKKTTEEIADEMQKKLLQCDPPRPPTGLIQHAFKNQTGTPIFPKDGSEVMSFTLPTGKVEALKLLDKIKLFRFKNQDVVEYIHGRNISFPKIREGCDGTLAVSCQSHYLYSKTQLNGN